MNRHISTESFADLLYDVCLWKADDVLSFIGGVRLKLGFLYFSYCLFVLLYTLYLISILTDLHILIDY